MRADWVAPLGGWLLTYWLHSTLLLGACWLLTRRGRWSAARRDFLWKTALLGGLISATVQSGPIGGSLAASFPLAMGPTPEAEATPTWSPAPSATGRDDGEAWHGMLGAAGPSPAQQASAGVGGVRGGAVVPDAKPAPAPGTDFLIRAGVVAWLATGLVLVLLYLIQRARALRRIGPRRVVEDVVLLGMLEGLRRSGQMRRSIRLTAAPGLGSPVALGGDEIVLPEAALTDLDPEQQRGLLAHELAHLARRDPAWLAASCVIERLFFLQPLNHVARLELQDAAEYLCDDWAVHRTGSGFSLARCLVKVAEWVDARPATVPLAGMAERRSQLVTRVHRLLEGRAMPATSRSVWFLAGAVTLVGLTAVAAPGVTSASRGTPGTSALVADTLEQLTPEEAPAAGLEEMLAAEVTAVADTDETANTRAARYLRMLERRARLQAARLSGRAYSLDAPLAARAPMAPMPPMPPAPPAALAPGAMAVAEARAYRLARTLSGARVGGQDRQGDTTSIAVPALIAALKDQDVEVRRAAVQSLMHYEDRRAVPALIEALRDGDAEVRASAAMALGQLEDARAGAPLAALLKDTSVDVRRSALYALHSVPGEVSTDAILAALADSDEDVRQAALALALSRMHRDDEDGDRTVDARYTAIFTRLLSDRSADVRQQAALALAESGLKEAPAALLGASRDKDSDVRQAVAMALGEIGDPKAVGSLKELLGDADADVRQQAISGLSQIRDRAALEALVGALKSSDPVVRRSAAEALGQREEGW